MASDKKALFAAVFRIQNRALRAEADLSSAMEEISQLRWKLHNADKTIGMQNAAIDKAHLTLDEFAFLPSRATSHLGLSKRVKQVKDFLSGRRCDLKLVSDEALEIMKSCHEKYGAPLEGELAVELRNRGML